MNNIKITPYCNQGNWKLIFVVINTVTSVIDLA